MSAIQNLQPFGEALCALGPGERAGPALAPPRGAVAIPGPVASAAGGVGVGPNPDGQARQPMGWRQGGDGRVTGGRAGAGPGCDGRAQRPMGCALRVMGWRGGQWGGRGAEPDRAPRRPLCGCK